MRATGKKRTNERRIKRNKKENQREEWNEPCGELVVTLCGALRSILYFYIGIPHPRGAGGIYGWSGIH